MSQFISERTNAMRDRAIVAAQAALDANWRENHRMMAAAAADAILALLAADRAAGVGEGEAGRLMHVIDRDRYVVAHCLGAIERAIDGRVWLLEGRGPYEWDDDRYREEFGDAIKAIREASQPLKIVAWDKSDCTRLEERVNAAKLAARELLAKPIGPREMVTADIFGDPRDAEIARLNAALAASPPAPADASGEVDDFLTQLRNGNIVQETLAAGAIIDVMTGGKCDWRSRINDSDFTESADWQTALAYARAALSETDHAA